MNREPPHEAREAQRSGPERRSHPPDERQEAEGLARHVALADWLLLGIVLLYHLVALDAGPALPMLGAMLAFALVGVAARSPRPFARHAAAKLVVQVWSGFAFVSFVLWHTGGTDSPLLSLYLLPIVVAALVLAPLAVAALLGAVAVAYVVLAALPGGIDVLQPAFVGRLLGAVGPFVVVAWLTAQLGTAVLAARRQATRLGDVDAVSGLPNRRVFLEALKREDAGAGVRRRPCAVVLLDVDGLGEVNEQHGYDAGNAVLLLVGTMLRRTLRETDLAARWGGDEFAVLLPGADLAAARITAQRIRNTVQAATLDLGTVVLRCGVSVGAAAAPADGTEAETLFAAAERRLEKDRGLRRRAPAVARAG